MTITNLKTGLYKTINIENYSECDLLKMYFFYDQHKNFSVKVLNGLKI